jgi:2-C-methyl-D-erythritol 4-phosphate cytidylyltransferase
LVPVSVVEVEVIALGRVLDEGRGSLPFALVHGEALVAAATWALSEAGVLPVDARTAAEGLADADLPLVLHDSLCPMTPPEFIRTCVRRAVEAEVVVVGVRPITDTVKIVHHGRLGQTVDRDAMLRVVSPLVVPVHRVAAEADLLSEPGADFVTLVDALRGGGSVDLVEAPAEALRVSGPEDLQVLEALTRPW